MFRKIDADVWALAAEVANRFPSIAKPGKFAAAADPFVIALARAENKRQPESLFDKDWECIVVTEEGGGAEKIPAACSAYRVKCINLVELLKSEGWVFN